MNEPRRVLRILDCEEILASHVHCTFLVHLDDVDLSEFLRSPVVITAHIVGRRVERDRPYWTLFPTIVAFTILADQVEANEKFVKIAGLEVVCPTENPFSEPYLLGTEKVIDIRMFVSEVHTS